MIDGFDRLALASFSTRPDRALAPAPADLPTNPRDHGPGDRPVTGGMPRAFAGD
jgi:hypothetical protein